MHATLDSVFVVTPQQKDPRHAARQSGLADRSLRASHASGAADEAGTKAPHAP